MMVTTIEKNKKIEYGDFQTPKELADLVCKKLTQNGISPDFIIEPTCGMGTFLESAARIFAEAQKFIGVEINTNYLTELRARITNFSHSERFEIKEGDFFEFDWGNLLKDLDGTILVLGNFPWVTNTAQTKIGGSNLPNKTNFQNHSGLDAMTGKSNFDISEFMLMKVAEWFQNRQGHLAMLLKTSVARKFLSHLHRTKTGVFCSTIYRIDAMRHFGAAVDACLLYCHFDPSSHNYDYDIYSSLDGQTHYRVGHRHGFTVRDLDTFEKLSHLFGNSVEKWRSGIKHDCSEVMELTEKDGKLFNGLNEVVDIEPDLIYPLIKGSDVANNRITKTDRYLLVPQKVVGEPTRPIKTIAPKTWAYLENHGTYLDSRKSRIYQNNPRFSIFGIGDYTFAPWKIAICGLYKNLNFRLVGQIKNKPVVFDDTVYFLGFEKLDEARKIYDFLYQQDTQDYLTSLIFWDDKRPIKTSILNSLKLNLRAYPVHQQQMF
jgi:hypothetical protein